MKLKVEKVEQALDEIIVKAKRHLAPIGLAASIVASTLTGCASNTITNYTEVSAADLAEDLQNEDALIQALKAYGIDDAVINSFKDAVNEEIKDNEKFDNTITEKEMLALGVTFKDDGTQLPAWWNTDSNIETDLRNYRDFIIASKTVDMQTDDNAKKAVPAETKEEDTKQKDVIKATDATDETEKKAEKHETAEEKATKVTIKNFGDATDDAVVTEKAKKVVDYYNQVGN